MNIRISMATLVLGCLAVNAPAEAGWLRGRKEARDRKAKPGYNVRANVPAKKDPYPHRFLKQVTLSHDGKRLYSYGEVEHGWQGWDGRRQTSRVPHVGNRRTVSRRDERRLRTLAGRQLAKERRGLALIAKGRADEGATLVRESRAPLVSGPTEVDGISERQDHGYVSSYDPFGRFVERKPNSDRSEESTRTVVVTFERVAGTAELRPVKLDVTGGKKPRQIDLATVPGTQYFGK